MLPPGPCLALRLMPGRPTWPMATAGFTAAPVHDAAVPVATKAPATCGRGNTRRRDRQRAKLRAVSASRGGSRRFPGTPPASLTLRREAAQGRGSGGIGGHPRSEEHTSELQSHSDLVCRLLLEKKKQ